MSGRHLRSGPYLDTAFFHVRGLLRLRYGGGVLRGPGSPYPCGGNGAFLRSAHELAAFGSGRFQLISNSDAHSPAKLGREANLLDTELSYAGLKRAVETGNGLAGTIEFFPEEGKYHFDGHRKCHICMSPLEAESHGGICPVCKKKMTMGVSHRIDQLADRPEASFRREESPLRAWSRCRR